MQKISGGACGGGLFCQASGGWPVVDRRVARLLASLATIRCDLRRVGVRAFRPEYGYPHPYVGAIVGVGGADAAAVGEGDGADDGHAEPEAAGAAPPGAFE